MPAYQLCLIVRATNKGVASVIRRTALAILERNCVLKEIENLGERDLPYRMRSHQEYFTRGRYVFLHFHGAPTLIHDLNDDLQLETDIIRYSILKTASQLAVGHSLSSILAKVAN
ncbi:small ribosomal subunit protein bS6m-like isoform X2 [Corticium candelabrum]|uniref:small ribosomal subunit protein bS6m-like isoform X2 n=1 Tax=Corticium candelabrum TaxID=121492 RepID=UPI002E2752E5|nr:small ribosomal subunit protein bS6m-like isoform X2 [Corticium candelabrum]